MTMISISPSVESPDRRSATPRREGSGDGVSITTSEMSITATDGTVLLDGVSIDIAPGELVAIVGSSGAGKSTLLDALAGNTLPTTGRVAIGRTSTRELRGAERRAVAFVPQDDVMHRELPLGRAVGYAAALRLDRTATRAEIGRAADDALAAVGLLDRSSTPIEQLSGGQRRRASIAMEIVTHPLACLLDEPTSGLDPATAAEILVELRELADRGSTVVFSTHHADDLQGCDRIIALAPGGRVAFVGSPLQALESTGARDLADFHRLVTRAAAVLPRVDPDRAGSDDRTHDDRGVADVVRTFQRGPSTFRQWRTLTTRSLDTILHNRLTLAIMIGSPAMVIGMFVVLFRSGAFDEASLSPTSTIMISFWVAFGGFFFGLTYGLLQICPELPIIRSERRAGVSPLVQLLAKLAALTPMLLLIDVAMLVVLRGLDRLPGADGATYVRLGITLGLDAIAALALGLLASASVTTPAQASLALPMLCFPAVLFSGAILPVPVMASIGRGISAVMSDRWAFEAIGHDLGLRERFLATEYPLGPALLEEYGGTWAGDPAGAWLRLAGFTVVFSLAAWVVLDRRCRAASH